MEGACCAVAVADLLEEKEAACMKSKLAKTGFKNPYDSDYDDDEPYEITVHDFFFVCSLKFDDVEDDNKESFIEKEAQKIREKGKAAYFRRGMFRCPYCTTKPKPRDGIYEHLMSHARGLSSSAEDIKTRAEHAALLKALGCCELCWNAILLMLWQDVMAASIFVHSCYSRMLWQDVMVDWLATGNISIQLSDVDSNSNNNNYRWVRWPWRQHHHRWSPA
ncbi:putative LRR receptor-like serine/threonine-protein kinase [Hordeum vulgare]|nr:putative LRR receptor-like serine/threonine-protein kinase [Hordeum vulgare]